MVCVSWFAVHGGFGTTILLDMNLDIQKGQGSPHLWFTGNIYVGINDVVVIIIDVVFMYLDKSVINIS